MQAPCWRVGELAAKTGLSIRTLRYYDEIGLLPPSSHSEAGYRLYAPGDVARLQQIKSLRSLGFSLHQIRDLLERPGHSSLSVIRQHLAAVKEQLALQHTLCARLEALEVRLAADEEVDPERFLKAIEVMNMIEHGKYYTPEQLEKLRRRGEELGPEQIHAVEAEWPRLIRQVRACMAAGTDPGSGEVQALAGRWRELVEAFTGGNPEISQSLRTMWQNEPGLRESTGIDGEMMAYIGKAFAAQG